MATLPDPAMARPGGRGRRWVRYLVGAAVLVGVGAVVVVVVGVVAYSRARVDTVGRVAFERPLAIPPVVEAGGDSATFDLALQTGTSEFVPGRLTPTWGVNGAHLGPTVRASRGQQVTAQVHNGLPASTTIHWHGMHLPAVADGNPHQPIEAGQTWSPTWTIDQPAATLWYHPHPHGRTAEHVQRGVLGLFIVDDDEPVDLPDDYGVDDIPVILQDVRINGDATLDLDSSFLSTVGHLGDTVLVNGTVGPYLEVGTELVRLRVLNASSGRIYRLGFHDDRSFRLVGTDGGLLERPVELRRLQVSPGERVEIVVGVEAGERAVLRSYQPDLGLDFLQGRFSGGDDRFDLVELRAGEDLRSSPPVPDRLVTSDLADPDDAVTTRRFALNGRSQINGEKVDMSRIDTVVVVDTTEIWEVTNRSGNPHNFHIHDVQFRVVDVDGRAPPPSLAGPKDTVFIGPGATVRLALRFTDYTDTDVPYMYHCHFLAHEDAGMMGQFVVVDAAEAAEVNRRLPGVHAAHG